MSSRFVPAQFLVLSTVLVLCGALQAPGQDKVGDASYIEGTVGLQRDGRQMDSSEVQTGLAIQNFDLVKTGADGLAEVRVTAPKAAGATIKVSPRTQFSFELNNTGSRQQTFVGLMSGTLALTVAKLTGSQDMSVHLDGAVMGVRGTEFTVTSPPSGDLLVTCRSGDVVCTDENGNEFHATPGSAVEKKFGEKFATLEVKGDVEEFRKKWEDERVAFLKEHAIVVIQREAARYDALADEFTESYAALQEKKEILAKWEREEKSGKIGSSTEVEKEKGEIAELIANLRETQFLLERVHYRLRALKEEYHDQGYGKGDIRKGLTTKAFFERFEKDRPDLEARMAFVRHMIKMFSHRNKGQDPTVVADLKRYYERRLARLRKVETHRKPVKKT
jgi:hypothetical protein